MQWIFGGKGIEPNTENSFARFIAKWSWISLRSYITSMGQSLKEAMVPKGNSEDTFFEYHGNEVFMRLQKRVVDQPSTKGNNVSNRVNVTW